MSFDIANTPTWHWWIPPRSCVCCRKTACRNCATNSGATLLDSVSRSSGHFASGLGTVELTVALHYVYNTPLTV
jgi:1-deoxy-D-xylulose-5-phosphate synthase